MKNKLDKLASSWKQDCFRRLAEKEAALRSAFITAKTEMELESARFAPVIKAIEDWNDEIDDIQTLIGYVTDQQHEYFDGRSESWQESDKGSDYTAWTEAWEDALFEFEEIACDPDEFDPDDYSFDEASILEELPDSLD